MFCIPILAKHTDESVSKILRANSLGDMLEIRLDLMESFDLQRIREATKKPLLVTYRSKEEGGKGDADPEIHSEILHSAIQAGADFIDVEFRLPEKCRQKILDVKGKSSTIISAHFNDGTPSRQDLDRIFRDCTATGADIIKIVTLANTWADNLKVLELIPRAQDLGGKIIAFCMGPTGRISRVLTHLMGGYLTFASLESGEESAKGQIPISEMRQIQEYFST